MWIEADNYYAGRYPQGVGEGEYGWWAYPLIKNKAGKPIERLSFGHLIDAVDNGSKFSGIYYDVATAKSHGRFVWSPLMIRPEGRGTHIDAFSVGGVALVLELTMPLFEEILRNTAPSCDTPAHGVVMDILKAIIGDIRDSVVAIKASNPDMHGGADLSP